MYLNLIFLIFLGDVVLGKFNFFILYCYIGDYIGIKEMFID